MVWHAHRLGASNHRFRIAAVSRRTRMLSLTALNRFTKADVRPRCPRFAVEIDCDAEIAADLVTRCDEERSVVDLLEGHRTRRDPENYAKIAPSLRSRGAGEPHRAGERARTAPSPVPYESAAQNAAMSPDCPTSGDSRNVTPGCRTKSKRPALRKSVPLGSTSLSTTPEA